MATITIKNIPDDIYAKLKENAKTNQRSVNSEVILAIKLSLLRPKVVDVEAFLERTRKIRELTAGYKATPQEIDDAINEGRS